MKTVQTSPLLLALLTAACEAPQQHTWIATAPAGDACTAIDRNGVTVLPNGRLLTPRGTALQVAPHPYGLVLSPDGKVLVTANSGIRPFSISIIRDVTGPHPTVQQVPEGLDTDKGILAAVFMGLAIAPDGATLYVGGGQEGRVFLFDLASGDRIGEIDANGTFGTRTFEDSYIGDLVLSEDGQTLYAVDQTNFRMIVVAVADRRVIASVPVGRYPFGIALTPDGTRVHVANVGMYEYSLLDGLDQDADPPRLGITFPPFAHGSTEATEGVEVEGYEVPGLGDPNLPESFSVWSIDVTNPEVAQGAQRRPVPAWVSRDGSVLVGAPSLPTGTTSSPGCGLTLGLTRCDLPSAVGAGTPGTAGIAPLLLSIGGFPYPGNADFGFVVVAGLGGAPGLLLLSGGVLPTAVPNFGFDLWVDPGLLAGSVPVTLSGPASVPGVGAAGVPLALPSTPSLAGAVLATQAVVLDAGAPQGLSATGALEIRVRR